MMSFPDPGIRDDEAINAIGRLEDRYAQSDLASTHPLRQTRLDLLGYGRWYSAYVVKRANGSTHEDAIRAVLAEINAVVIPKPPPPPPPGNKSGHESGRLHAEGLILVQEE